MATKKEGVADLLAKLDEHRTWLDTTEAGGARRQERLLMELTEHAVGGVLARGRWARSVPKSPTLAARISRSRNRPVHGVGGAHPPFPPGALDVLIFAIVTIT